MKRLLFILLAFLGAQSLKAQAVLFSYDASGNRVQRQICLTCRKGQKPLKDSLGAASITLYPNPAKGVLYLKMEREDLSVPTYISMFDLQGRQVSNMSIVSGLSSIDLSAQPVGTYLLKLKRGDNEVIWKIVKEE